MVTSGDKKTAGLLLYHSLLDNIVCRDFRKTFGKILSCRIRPETMFWRRSRWRRHCIDFLFFTVKQTVYNCIVYDHRLAQLSSFLRVGPISSHNLSRQLLKMEDRTQFIVYTVVGTWKNVLILAKLYLEKRTYFISSNNYEFMNEYCIEWYTVHYMCASWTHHCTWQAGHGKGRLLGKTTAAKTFGPLDTWIIYLWSRGIDTIGHRSWCSVSYKVFNR